MSYTELFYFDKKGDAHTLGEVNNSFRSAYAIWQILEKKYLKSLPKPFWMSDEDYKKDGYSRLIETNVTIFLEDSCKPMREIWGLFESEKLSRNEKIVLATTFDKAVVFKENFIELIAAFKSFEGQTSLEEQAEIIQRVIDTPELVAGGIIAIAWNQTSVVADNWINYNGYDEETEEYKPYNILNQSEHQDLFQGLK